MGENSKRSVRKYQEMYLLYINLFCLSGNDCNLIAFSFYFHDGLKNKNCLATLSAQIKRNNKDTRYRDPFIKEGLCAIIKINFHHSHKINVAEAWNWLPRFDTTKQNFIDYFATGKFIFLAEDPEMFFLIIFIKQIYLL